MSENNQKGTVKSRSLLMRLITWLLAFGCFYVVYGRVVVAAAREGLTPQDYLVEFFAGADWVLWLCLMIPYSLFFFVVDSHATWRTIRWFNAPEIKLTQILPIRASAYILSLVNEQVGKGAMSMYLLRAYKVPGWEALSSMILLGVVEIYQLLIVSGLGVFLYTDLVEAASSQLPLNQILPAIFMLAMVYIPFHLWYFSGRLLPGSAFRNKPLLRAFKMARPINYVLLLLFKLPNLLMAVVVYTVSLKLFHVPVSFGQLLAFLPVIFLAAALPLPFHAGALLLWTVLFPDYPEVGVFSLIMHTFFLSFNAMIGLIFLPKANKELFG
ncbi:MAG: hypothetical protein KUG75_02605 [Pseudomonadales bacterium]|nr:hypothetical protein [Pseudomonadales bacterium]